jgi:hypothetical protein
MPNVERLWREFKRDWDVCGQDVQDAHANASYHTVLFLKEILQELQAQRPMVGRLLSDGIISDTQSAHDARLRLVMDVAIEELNVAPQVAEYARRILMGCRPEPDLGVMEALWGYVGADVPEGYTLVDKRAVALRELVERATNDGVHPAAAELARRILAGDGPSVSVYRRVTRLRQQLFDPQTDVAKQFPVECEAAEDVDLTPPRTVMVVGPDVDLEPGDLGEEGSGA